MIKKTTKVIFEDNEGESSDELVGGMPLSKGDIVHIHRGESVVDYFVADKIIDCYLDGIDQLVNITYKLEKQENPNP